MDKLFNEIIQEVAYQLPGKDIKNARLISRSLNQAVEPVLWDTLPVTVHLNGPTLRKQMTMLNDLKNGFAPFPHKPKRALARSGRYGGSEGDVGDVTGRSSRSFMCPERAYFCSVEY
ncbi:hypothetical protein MPER_06046 [Moniliophthora perniciosa FA553]|nr:hypothetical protein MPER_06046 [Moniliophthora perniciosa FA553]